MIARWWTRWARAWDGDERPTSLALMRIFLGLCLLYDFGSIAAFDLVLPMFAPDWAGGWSDVLTRGKNVPLIYQWLPPTAGTAKLLYGGIIVTCVTFTLGFWTRTSAAVLCLLYAQHALVLPLSDRGIDMMCRNLLFILAFSGAGASLSLDAWIGGDPLGREAHVAAWPRRLIIVQLVVMYFTAGVQKVGVLWLPMGGFAALYVILQDPAIARFDFAWLINEPWLFGSRVGTAGTLIWQSAYPIVFLWYYYRDTADQPGRLRAFSNRWRLHLVWIGVGALFHLMLAVTMELGIFPWAMMAAYPAFVHPDEWRELLAYLTAKTAPTP